MRTNKAQRTAYNLTKMSGWADSYFDLMDCGIAELAKDHNIVCIDLGRLMEEVGEEAEQRWVFIPQDEWDKETKEYRFYMRAGIEDPKRTLRTTAMHWYDMAMMHKI